MMRQAHPRPPPQAVNDDKRAPKPDRLERLARQGCPDEGSWIWPPLQPRETHRTGRIWLTLIVFALAIAGMTWWGLAQ